MKTRGLFREIEDRPLVQMIIVVVGYEHRIKVRKVLCPDRRGLEPFRSQEGKERGPIGENRVDENAPVAQCNKHA